MRRPVSWSFLASTLLLACGGTKTPAATADAKAPAAVEATEDAEAAGDAEASAEGEEAQGIPRECAKSGDSCVPPKGFVDRLCKGSFPGVALHLFEKSSPWTRGYVRVKTEPVNASGGVTGEGDLVPGEEVVIVRVRAQPKDGMQVSGAGGWDAVRWDGTCATLSEGEMGLEEFGPLKAAPVTFRYLDEPIQTALRANPAVDEAYANRRKHCKGATMGEVTKECEKWDVKLSEAVVAAVRGGIELPTPEKLP